MRAGFVRGGDLNHGQVADDGGFVSNVLDQQYVDQFVEIGLDAARLVEIGVDGNSHARDFGLLGAADGERIDVEGAATEQRSHSRQHAWLVFYVNHICVQH